MMKFFPKRRNTINDVDSPIVKKFKTTDKLQIEQNNVKREMQITSNRKKIVNEPRKVEEKHTFSFQIPNKECINKFVKNSYKKSEKRKTTIFDLERKNTLDGVNISKVKVASKPPQAKLKSVETSTNVNNVSVLDQIMMDIDHTFKKDPSPSM